MLQTIRDRTHGWIAGIIISLLILSFALWGISSYFNGGSHSNTVATVNGIEITKGQLAATYERMRRQLLTQYAASNAPLTDKIETNLKQQALQILINMQVQKQASLDQHYRVSSQQVDNYLLSIPDFRINGQFSMARFQQILTSTLLSVQEFLDLVATNLLIDQPRLGVIFTSFALPHEISETYSLVQQTRNVHYTVLPFNQFSRQPITIPEEKIQAYYQQHESEFHTPEQLSISYIQLSLNDLISKVQPSEAVLTNFYKDNSSSYSTPMRWKLEGILIPTKDQHSVSADLIVNKIKQGINFSHLMREYPTIKKIDPKILDNWVTLNTIPVEWQSAVATLNKPNQISPPISSKEGTVILKVKAYEEPKVQPYAQVKDKVRDTYIHQQSEEKFAELKEKLANLTYEHPDTLENAAKELNLPIRKTELFTREKGNKDISADHKIRAVAFSHEVLNQQNNSDVIPVDSETLLVLRVNTHVLATLLPLKTVRSQIEEKLKAIEIQAKAFSLAQEIATKLQQDSMTAVTQRYHLTWKELGFIGRHSIKVDSAISNSAFSMPIPTLDKPTSFSIAKIPEGYAVIALNAVKQGSLDIKNHDQYVVFAEQFQNTQGLLEYELYKESQLSHSKVVIQ
jgi:peptidyl-prolyl cis-trans isomerase D